MFGNNLEVDPIEKTAKFLSSLAEEAATKACEIAQGVVQKIKKVGINTL